MSRIGADSFKLIVDHFKPDDVTTKEFDEIVSILNTYYGKKVYVLSERVSFTLRYRREDETVAKFLMTLREIASNCEFGNNLHERLRDQLVVGINNSQWQQELI